jgi:MFS family permease
MFIPQVVTAVTSSLLGGRLARRFGTKRVLLAGLLADLTSMVLLIMAFGTGPLVDAGVGLPTLFGIAAAAAVVMGALSFVLARNPPPRVSTAGAAVRQSGDTST